MSMVTRSSRKLNEQEVSSRRSSDGWKETQTIMKGSKASVSVFLSSSSLRRSQRVSSSNQPGASSPCSRKYKKADISISHVASLVGSKRKSREEDQDSLSPPSKCAFRPSEKKATQKSPEARTGDRQGKIAKKPNTDCHPEASEFEQTKAIKKPEKKQQSKSSTSLDKKKLEEGKTGKLLASLKIKKSDERKANKPPGSLNTKKRDFSKTSKLPSSLKIRTSEEGKIGTSSGKSERSNRSGGSNSRDSSEHVKLENEVVREARSSKSREDKSRGETSKTPPSSKLGTTSKRLDARRYRELFASKPREQKEGRDAGQCFHMVKSGCSETIASDKVGNEDVSHENINHGDGYVNGDAENGNFCRLRSGKNIVKSIPATENSIQQDSENMEPEAGIHNAEGDPQASASEESQLLSKHFNGYVSNSLEVLDFSQIPIASGDCDSHKDSLSDDHPHIDCQMALPCENAKIPSTSITGSPEKKSLDDITLSNYTSSEAKSTSGTSQIAAADSYCYQINKNLSGSHTSKGGLEEMLSPLKDLTQADLQLYDGTSRLNEKSTVSCTSKEGQVVIGCDDHTSVGTKKEFCTLDVSKDDKASGLLSGKKRGGCEETLESSCIGNSIHGIENPKKSRLDDTLVASEDTKRLQMVREGGGGASINHSLLESSKMKHPKDAELNTCGVCEHGGKLLYCDGKGCNRAYHLSCLEPPLTDTPPGTWHCLWCMKRKLEFGLHSVSEGVESIWAVRADEKSLDDGLSSTQRQVEKEYFVKHRGLAHVHNRWIPERQLLTDAPKILSKFNIKYQKNKAPKWKSEWKEPERLLKKRLLMPPKVAEEYFRNNAQLVYCNGEWLVKWKGLGYEFCTWEMENEPFLTSSEGMTLVEDFETRREKAKQASCPSRANMVHSQVDMHIKMQNLYHEKLPVQGLDVNNKLYEYWHRGQNAVIIDDQERIARATMFISLLVSRVSRPFLILSPSSAFAAWESEIMRVEPHIDLVVYNGCKNVRDMIRGLEFYEETGCIMFQVLLSTPDAVAEDMEFLECIGWESIIVDQCHSSKLSKLFKKISLLNTDFRLLLFNEQIKESILDYLNIFSLLDPKDDYSCIDSRKDDDNGKELSLLKQRLSSHVIYVHKSASSKFVEHWTPAFLSNAQLGQYCSILVSNFRSLKLKNDSLNPLSNILLSLKKCCDHPYLVDESLQNSLTAGSLLSEILDIGVKASGKLMLLDKILSEIKNKGLRVLILFQFIGGLVPHSIGDILDDYLRQRFGEDSYERVDSGIALSKKQLALNMFNDKGKGRFVFLLENRACAPSIKLSSVDTIIVFGSDWNPSNDLKALQKINIDFQTEQLTVFRLYTPHTLEEKSLRFYTENMVLDNRLDSLSPSIMHMLLMWGTFYLFKKFDELQDPKIQHSGSIFPGNERLLEETFQEVVSLLPPVTNVNSPIKNSAILKMKQKVSFVSKSTLFFGESQPCFSDREQPHIYWNKLLEGRVDVGSVTGLVERPRRKVHRFVPSSTKLAENEDQIKNQKAADISNVASSSPVILAEDISGEEFTTHLETGSTPVIPRNDHVLETSSSNMVELEDGIDSRTTQQHLHELLKPELLKLCTALRLPKSVVDVAEVSLDYVMKSHQVPKESESILQAFLMSLCWTSASMLKYGVDHEASVMLAKEQLLFKCEKTEVKSVYKRLRRFRPYLKINILSKVVDQSSKDNHENINSNSVPHERLQELAGKTISEPEGRRCIDNEGPLLQGEGPKSEELDVGVNHKNTYHKDGADQEKASETTILLHKVYSLKKKRMKYIIDKQKEEFSEFLKFREMEFSKITKEYRACLFDIEKESDFFIKEEKRRIRSQDFRDRKTSHNNRMNSCGKNLTDKQRNLRDREAQTYSYWVEQAKAGRSVEPYLLLRLPNILFRKEDLENASQNLANEIAAKMSQNGNANEGVTSKPLTSGLDNIPAISGLAVATVRASGVSVTSSDASSVLTTASQADLEGQGTLICSEAVKNTSTVGSVDVLASMTLDNQADSVTRPLEHNILTKSNHITAVDSETDSTHATLETDQIGKPDTSLRQKNGSASQMADRLTTELGHEQVSSVVPGERSAPGGARDHDNEVAGPDALTSSSSAVQVHVSTVDHERPVSAEMEGDTGLGSSQAGVSAGSLDPFLSLSRQVVQASSAGSDGRSTSAETVRDSEHGVAELESFHEAVAPVAQPLDACPSSAEHVTEAHFCMDSSRGSICAETAEGLCGLESPCHAWGPVQQPLGTFPLSAERAQVHSANPNEGSATTESARAETAKEHDHSLGRSDHAGSPVQQPLGAIPLSAQGVQVSSANHDERSASAESAKVETTEPVHGLGDLQSPCHAGGPVQQPFDTLPLSAKEVHISCGNPDERSTYVEPVRAETGRDHGLGRLATPYERSASAETARESSRAVAFVSLPQLRVSLQQPYDASHSSAERVEHCPSAFWPASLPLPPLDGVRITSSNTGAGTTGSESGGFSTALGSLVDYPDPLRRALVRMCMEADQAKMLYEDEKVRLAAERDKVIEEVKRKYAEKFQEAKLKCAVAEEELTKLQLNRCLAVIFWRFLATGPRKLVVQPGNCSIGASFQQSGYGPHGSAAHRTDLVSTDRNRPSSASPLIAGNLQVSCGSRDLRPTPVPSRPPPTNPADLVYLSDDDQL